MGHWNYRLCRSKAPNAAVYTYGIHEAYYNSDGTIWAVTEDAVSVGFDEFEPTDNEAAENMKKTLRWMSEALDKPMLDLDNFVFAPHAGSENEDIDSD
jgi:hypothetical protein